MKTAQESKRLRKIYEGFSKSTVGRLDEEKIERLGLIIGSVANLKLRRQLAEIVLYLMVKNDFPKENENFQKIAKLIGSPIVERLSKGIRSRFGLKEQVDYEKATIQKLFKQYEPRKYDLDMIIRRLKNNANITIPPETPAIKTDEALASSPVSEAQVMPPEPSAMAGAGEPTSPKTEQAHSPAPPVGNTDAALASSPVSEAQVMPPEPSAVAGAGQPTSPKAEQAHSPAPPVRNTDAALASSPVSEVQVMPPEPSAVAGAGQPTSPKTEQAESPGAHKDLLLEELKRRLKELGIDTSEHEFVATAPAKDDPSPKESKPGFVMPSMVSFFEQAKKVKLRPTAKAKVDKEDGPPTELEQSEKEIESKKGPSKS